MEENTHERTYAKPEIVDHGTLAELTAGSSIGGSTDMTFPAGTPKGQLTFSGPSV